MTYKEKQVWVTLLTGMTILALYLRKALSVFMAKGDVVFDDTVFWAKTMLMYIGIGVVLVIVMMIVFNILLAVTVEVTNKIKSKLGEQIDDPEGYDDVEDEMDRLINLKAGQLSYIVVGIGFVSGLITMALTMAPGIMMNITYISFMLGGILEGAVKLHYYKRGVSHG